MKEFEAIGNPVTSINSHRDVLKSGVILPNDRIVISSSIATTISNITIKGAIIVDLGVPAVIETTIEKMLDRPSA